ncbi:Lrp/AsnC ligand binding domain-containing protein [Roseomonas sp. NAR14]|uniref:Lrp/AsnC ligand binding domain-containing protein n=1 Tax=Roseomonas acroporae TaxID=2937791 RepID=A0A9X1Y7T5_9PROT|nr:Lrp/AsnC ligand binding domain-containing protein [Roseomonas acroporae]MCK8783677.1 Lrp/AsnC ligand binding domain-containing protein [Roseomonas acroporae]
MRAIFVFFKCEPGRAYAVARDMADTVEELSEMHSVSGPYDLLGKFYLEADRDIGLFVVERLQTMPGVKDTQTIQAFNAFTGGAGRQG